MRHADSNVLYAVVDRAIDERFHSRNECFAALDTEAFLIRVFAGNELFKRFGPDETVEDHALLVDSVVPGFGCFNTFTDPVALFLIGNVNILDANGAAW